MPDTRPLSTDMSAEERALQPLQGHILGIESPCSALMTTQPVCCEPGDPADVVARLMVVEDIGAVPVVNNLHELHPIGMITDRDLVVKVVAEGHDPKSIVIDEVMTRTALTCMAERPIQEAIDLMAEHQVRRVPIIDAEHRLVGIIAQADIAARLARAEETAHVLREVSQAIPERRAASSVTATLPPSSTSLKQKTPRKEQRTMPRGEKSAPASTQKRQAKHAEDSYDERGVAKDEAERRTRATANKQTGDGKKRSPAHKTTSTATRPTAKQAGKKPASSGARKTAAGGKRG